MAYEKYIKDGKVAVLYSPGFGAGWYSWNTSLHDSEALLFDSELVEAVLNKDQTLMREITDRKYPDAYSGGVEDLEIGWLDIGEHFTIHEYDGSEHIERHNVNYLVA